MCGRTSLAVPFNDLRNRFNIETATDAAESYPPQYNVDPSDGLVTITDDNPSKADVFEWGFVPAWADEEYGGPTPINARVETVEDSNMFHDAFQNRRCLLIADGFYEWKDSRGSKQPYRIRRRDEKPFAFAGLWSQRETGGADRYTATILTTEPNDVVEPVHDRMPVLLERDEEEQWLEGDIEDARTVLDPYPADPLEAFPVSKAVNNPGNESPDLFEPIDIGDQSDLDDFAS